MNWILGNLQDMVSTWNSKMLDINWYLLLTPQSFSQKIWQTIKTINGTIEAIATALIVLFFVYGMIKSMADFEELKRPSQALRFFLRFAISKVVVTYSLQIMMKIFEIVNLAVIKTLASNIGNSGYLASVPKEIVTAVSKTNVLEQIPLGAVTILGGLFVTIMSFIMILTVYGRFFKLYLYTAISPLPLSTIASHETEHIARSFIKSYIGICLEGLVIALCTIIFSLYISESPGVSLGSEEAVTMVWKYIGEMVFNMLILVGSVRISDRIVREMMGI